MTRLRFREAVAVAAMATVFMGWGAAAERLHALHLGLVLDFTIGPIVGGLIPLAFSAVLWLCVVGKGSW